MELTMTDRGAKTGRDRGRGGGSVLLVVSFVSGQGGHLWLVLILLYLFELLSKQGAEEDVTVRYTV